MIPDTVTELAYYSSYRALPRIVRVERLTPTTVKIEASNYPFRRDNGRQKGGYTSGGYVDVVTPEILDHIAAAAKQEPIRDLRLRVNAAFLRQAHVRVEAAYTRGHETNLRAAESTIAALTTLLAELGEP